LIKFKVNLIQQYTDLKFNDMKTHKLTRQIFMTIALALLSISSIAQSVGIDNRAGFSPSSLLDVLDGNNAFSTSAKSPMANFTSGTGITSGTVFNVNAPYVGFTGNLLSANTTSTSAATGATNPGFVNFTFSGSHTGNGFEIDDATQSGVAMRINANSITSGSGLQVISGASGLTTGWLVDIEAQNAGTVANNALVVKNSSTYNTSPSVGGNCINAQQIGSGTSDAILASSSGSAVGYSAIYGTNTPTSGGTAWTILASNHAIASEIEGTQAYSAAVFGHGNGTGNPSAGVVGSATGAGTTNYGLYGTALNGSSINYGVYGTTASTATHSAGVFGTETAASGLVEGVWGDVPNGGSGVGVVGTNEEAGGAGMQALAENATGVGIEAVGNNANSGSPYVTGNGEAGAFTGTTVGIYAVSTSAASGSMAGEFWLGSTPTRYSYVAYYDGFTHYGILSNGTKSTVIKDQTGKERIMACTESPEILFEDYGNGKLENGKAHINIDTVFAYSITVNEKHPLRVYIQLEGDCNGVYVTNKTTNGFDVIELKGGTSNVAFGYHVIGNRKDNIDAKGECISKHADNRYEYLDKKMGENQKPKVHQTITKESLDEK